MTNVRKDHLEFERTFVTRMIAKCSAEPGVRADLRKGLKRSPAKSPSMHRHVAPFLPETSDVRERAFYAVAAMLASTPTPADDVEANATAPESARNLGRVMAMAVKSGAISEQSANTRLRLLTKQDQQGLIRYLPATARQIARHMTVDTWTRLLADLARWPYTKNETGKRWLQSFYRELYRAVSDAAKTTNEPGTQP